jgi:hypothetical protein
MTKPATFGDVLSYRFSFEAAKIRRLNAEKNYRDEQSLENRYMLTVAVDGYLAALERLETARDSYRSTNRRGECE